MDPIVASYSADLWQFCGSKVTIFRVEYGCIKILMRVIHYLSSRSNNDAKSKANRKDNRDSDFSVLSRIILLAIHV